MNFEKICRQVRKKYGVQVDVTCDERSIFLKGSCRDWQTSVAVAKQFVDKTGQRHVVNDIVPEGFVPPQPMLPQVHDQKLQDTVWDVVVVGGGISGCAVARELSRYDLKILLCEKHGDVAHGGASAKRPSRASLAARQGHGGRRSGRKTP